MTEKEGSHHRTIVKLEVNKWIVLELVLLSRFGVKQGHLEDKRDAFRAARRGKSRRSVLIFRSAGRHQISVVSKGLNKGPNKR